MTAMPTLLLGAPLQQQLPVAAEAFICSTIRRKHMRARECYFDSAGYDDTSLQQDGDCGDNVARRLKSSSFRSHSTVDDADSGISMSAEQEFSMAPDMAMSPQSVRKDRTCPLMEASLTVPGQPAWGAKFDAMMLEVRSRLGHTRGDSMLPGVTMTECRGMPTAASDSITEAPATLALAAERTVGCHSTPCTPALSTFTDIMYRRTGKRLTITIEPSIVKTASNNDVWIKLSDDKTQEHDFNKPRVRLELPAGDRKPSRWQRLRSLFTIKVNKHGHSQGHTRVALKSSVHLGCVDR